MIVIYNLTGLLFGALGIVLGLVAARLTGWLPAAALVIGVVWIVFGWRKRNTDQPELRRPAPSIFFVPLRIWGVLALLLVVPVALLNRAAVQRDSDPRMQALRADEQTLKATQVGGDLSLSRAVSTGLADIANAEVKAGEFHVFTRTSDRAVLVLLQADNLKEFSEEARRQLINFITGIVWAETTADRDVYIGVRGRVAYGAVAWPDEQTQFGKVVSPNPLLAFYDQSRSTSGPATTESATEPAIRAVEPSPIGQ
jgi:hypothetical protein